MEVRVRVEDRLELASAVGPAGIHVEDAQPRIAGEQAIDGEWRRPVRLRGTASVLERDDRAMACDGAERASEDALFGALHVDLDEVRHVTLGQIVIEPRGADRDRLSYTAAVPIDARAEPTHPRAVLHVRERGLAVRVGERHAPDVDPGERGDELRMEFPHRLVGDVPATGRDASDASE